MKPYNVCPSPIDLLNSAIALLGIYPQDTDAVKGWDTCTPMFIAAMSTIAKLWKDKHYMVSFIWEI